MHNSITGPWRNWITYSASVLIIVFGATERLGVRVLPGPHRFIYRNRRHSEGGAMPRRQNLTIRTVNKKTGQVNRGFRIQNISTERAAMVKRAAEKALANVAPERRLLTVHTPSERTSGKATVEIPGQTSRGKSSVSMSDVPQGRWDAIFGKKKNKPKRRPTKKK